MNLEITVAPASLPISVAEAKRHLRVTGTDEDTHIKTLIRAATAHVEALTRRALVTRTAVMRMDAFPSGAIEVPLAPLRSVTSIAYIDTAGDSQTWAASKYDVDVRSRPGRIEPAYGEVYPSTRDDMNAVTVTFVCGHATLFTVVAATDVLTATGHPYAEDGAIDGLYMSGPEGVAMPAGLSEDTVYYADTVVAATSMKLAASSGGAAIDVTDTGTGTGAQFYAGVVHPDIRAAILLLVGHWFEHREDVITGTIVTPMRRAVDALLANHCIYGF